MVQKGNPKEQKHAPIVKRKLHAEEEGGHGGVWKLAFADFMTALMTFFLVMWLINSASKEKIIQLASYFNPVKLSDRSPSSKGVRESKQGGAEKRECGRPKKPAKEEDRTQRKIHNAFACMKMTISLPQSFRRAHAARFPGGGGDGGRAGPGEPGQACHWWLLPRPFRYRSYPEPAHQPDGRGRGAPGSRFRRECRYSYVRSFPRLNLLSPGRQGTRIPGQSPARWKSSRRRRLWKRRHSWERSLAGS